MLIRLADGEAKLLLVEHFWVNGNGFGEVCWKSSGFNVFQLRGIKVICALLQRMGISFSGRLCGAFVEQ